MGQTNTKEDIEFVELVGKGFFGEVYKAKYSYFNESQYSAKEAVTRGQFLFSEEIRV